MILQSPVRGIIRVNAENYPTHPLAWKRPAGNHEPAVTHDFGPSGLTVEPTVVWPGGEADIFGKPIPAGTYGNFHVGIDIGNAGCGYDVLAAGAGKVTTSSRNASGAEVIVIDHGQGFATRYVHMSRRLVLPGAIVTASQLIAKTGDTGVSTGCHLHWAATKDGKPIDPWRRLAQNTTTDPDQESDMPAIATYIPGHVARISNGAGNVNVRATPTLGGKLIRQIPQGTAEEWKVTGWVTGDVASGSDQWLCRWSAGWEYVHKVNVVSVTAVAADCTAAVKAATDPLNARIAAIKGKVAAGAVDIADD
jgi:hypothetical protein